MLITGAITPQVKNDKGSFGNRINCAGAHLANFATTTAGVVGSVVATDYLVTNSEKVKGLAEKVADKLSKVKMPEFVKTGIQKGAEILEKGWNTIKKSKIGTVVSDKVKNALNKLKDSKILNYIKEGLNKATPWLKTTSIKFKALAEKAVQMFNKLPKGGKIALGATVAAIVMDGIYKSGQIDQKYTDRAKMEKNLV